jgi:lipopolysaccharide transport system permease protein
MGELQQYHTHISAHHNFFDLKLDELFRYRDLVFLFAKRSITVTYTQTVLGPLWLMLNPLLTSIMHTLVFGHIAGIRTSGVPRILFYLCGNAIWGFYAACLKKASGTFVNNAGIFGKVYFPRLAVPLSDVLAEAVKLGIQMLLVLAFLLFYVAQGAAAPRWQAGLLLPLQYSNWGCWPWAWAFSFPA